MSPSELENKVRELLDAGLSDQELREALELLAKEEISFGGLTWMWGPELYQRNKLIFRPFILSNFSPVLRLPKRVKDVKWEGAKRSILEKWLREVDAANDVELFRRLYDWKLSAEVGWGAMEKRSAALRKELLERFKTSRTGGEREIILSKFDLWLQLDEETAAQLYEKHGPAAGNFILKHLPFSFWSGEDKRVLWSRVLQLAERRGDEDFKWKLYRKQVSAKQWEEEALRLCKVISNRGELVAELRKRHPSGYGLNLGNGFLKLLEARGPDVFGYIMPNLRQVWGSWFGRGAYGKVAFFAKERGWWELWTALVRTCVSDKEFNKEILLLVKESSQTEVTIRQRLLMLAGVSREWNWGGFGLAAVHQLEEEVALKMYERFPDLVRGVYKMHVQANAWGKTYPRLLDEFIAKGDEAMVDYLASRYITRSGRWGNAPKMVQEAERLADYYQGLKANEGEFSRRAATVLGQIPAYTIWNYNQLLRENRLARLLFERSFAVYLEDEASMADLVEAAEIHVMVLAYRTLGLDDDRARKMAAAHLPLLLGTLLRPLQRATRVQAFGALFNAANTLENARVVLRQARSALKLPDKKYPKEQLLGLIGKLLHRWPELREERETPVIYERAA